MSKAINLEQLKLLAQKSKAEADKISADIAEYSIVKQETAESGFLSTYQLTKDGDANAEHIYLAVNELANVYTGGNGVIITDSSVAVKVNAANANGLTVDENGLALAAATTTTAGAMSAADKSKLDSIKFATDEEVDAMLDGVFGA